MSRKVEEFSIVDLVIVDLLPDCGFGGRHEPCGVRVAWTRANCRVERSDSQFGRFSFAGRSPIGWEARRIGGQLIDAATSVHANYRATCRARSRAEFIAKLGIVAEECDECVGWLELIQALDLSSAPEMAWLLGESNELLAIFSQSQKTAKENRQQH